MSHFTVLVAANDEQELKAKLQPFHEYECTGIKDQYVVFVPAKESLEEMQTEYKEHEGYDSFEQFVRDWYGYELQNGVYGSLTNPNEKWDWWVVGGRWSNTLIFKDGTKGDFGKAGQVDWERIKHKLRQNARDEHFVWQQMKGIQDNAKRKRFVMENGFHFITNDEAEKLDSLTEEEYANLAAQQPLTFAFIDQKGEWHERAEMGWFAMTSNHNDNAGSEFWTFVESLDPDQGLYVVDCHI